MHQAKINLLCNSTKVAYTGMWYILDVSGARSRMSCDYSICIYAMMNDLDFLKAVHSQGTRHTSCNTCDKISPFRKF